MNRAPLFRRAAAFGLLASAVLSLRSQPADLPASYALREWHGEQGLPNEVVQDVIQDRQGYLWIAAEGGLARFNGSRFDLRSPVSSHLLVGSTFHLITHPEYGLLFSSNTGEIWQRSGDAFVRSPVLDKFSRQPVTAWFVQNDGTLWAGFVDGKIECLRQGVLTEVKLDESAPQRSYVTFAGDGGDGVWIARGSALFHHRDGQTEQVSAPFKGGELRIASSNHGRPWLITRTAVGRWNGQDLESPVPVPDLLSAHFVRTLIEDTDGKLWVGTRSQGAYFVADGRYVRVPTSHRSINALRQDNEGNIWAATGGGGLNRLQAQSFRLYDSKSGLQDDITFSICEDVAGRIWFANRDGGIARLAREKIELMTGRPDWPNVTGGRVFPDAQGGVWFSCSTGLFKTDPAGETARKIDAVSSRDIFRCLYATRAGVLWLAGGPGELGRLDANGFTPFSTADGFPRQQATSITEDPEGRILVGTDRGELLRLHGARFEPLRPPGATPLAPVRTLIAEKDGPLWVATAGGGLNLIADGKDHFLTTAHGLPDDVISQMLFDDFGSVWLGTAHGIFRAHRREILDFVSGRTKAIHAAAFGKNDGLEHLSCLDGPQPSCWKTTDGTLWFPTRRGVLTIDPRSVRSRGLPPAFIDELRVDETPLPLAAATRIRSDARKIEVRFSVLNFTAPERTPVRYRLEGFDREWTKAEAERKAVYPRLLPGKYRLHLAVADDDGNWTETAAPLALTIIPFWWQTLWFRLAAALALLLALTFAVRKMSHRRLRRKAQRLEHESAVERERARIARDIHDELGASLTRISLLAQSAPSAPPADPAPPHRACLDEIYTTTTAITRSINEIVWAIDGRHDNLDSMVSYLDSYAQGFLSVAKIRYRLHAPTHLPERTVSSRVRHNLFLAYKEALNNSVKYAAATEVTVRIDTAADHLHLSVSDNGRGLPPSSPTPGHTAPAPARADGGNGLPNLATRLADIGGKTLVRNLPAGGTEIIFTLPLGLLTS